MPLSALGLVLGAACLHALWNVLLAKARDIQAATAVLLVVPIVLCAPAAALVGHLTWDAAPWIAVSGALELLYFALLAAAYTRSEVSLVYPIARGLGLGGFAAYALVLAALRLAPAAPVAAARESSVVIATVLAALILHERVTRLRLAGSILVVGGVALLALS